MNTSNAGEIRPNSTETATLQALTDLMQSQAIEVCASLSRLKSDPESPQIHLSWLIDNAQILIDTANDAKTLLKRRTAKKRGASKSVEMEG
jgi:hypothetical protein